MFSALKSLILLCVKRAVSEDGDYTTAYIHFRLIYRIYFARTASDLSARSMYKRQYFLRPIVCL